MNESVEGGNGGMEEWGPGTTRARSIVNKVVRFFIFYILLITTHNLGLDIEERRNVVLSDGRLNRTTLPLRLLCPIFRCTTPLADMLRRFDLNKVVEADLACGRPAGCVELKFRNRSSGGRRGHRQQALLV